MAKRREYPSPLSACPPIETWWPQRQAWLAQNIEPELYHTPQREARDAAWAESKGLTDYRLPHEQPEREAT